MTSAPNPYEPTLSTRGAVGSMGKRSYALTAIAGLLAIATMGLAAFVLIETIPIARRQGFDTAILAGSIAMGVMVVFSLIWFLAAYFAWTGKRRRSLVITLVNFFAFAAFGLLLGV